MIGSLYLQGILNQKLLHLCHLCSVAVVTKEHKIGSCSVESKVGAGNSCDLLVVDHMESMEVKAMMGRKNWMDLTLEEVWLHKMWALMNVMIEQENLLGY